MATIPGLNNLAIAGTGLSTQDKWEITERNRQISSAAQRAQRNYNTGIQTATNEQNIGLRRATMGLNQNKNLGLSQAADSGFGNSPAVAGAAIAAAAQRYAQQQAQVQQDNAAARAALERMSQEARITQSEEMAALVREAARRREYAAEIRSLS